MARMLVAHPMTNKSHGNDTLTFLNPESIQNLVVNGRSAHAVFFERFGNKSLLLGVDILFAALEAIVESFAKVVDQILLDGRSYGSVHFIVDVRHALSIHLSGFLLVIRVHCC